MIQAWFGFNQSRNVAIFIANGEKKEEKRPFKRVEMARYPTIYVTEISQNFIVLSYSSFGTHVLPSFVELSVYI